MTRYSSTTLWCNLVTVILTLAPIRCLQPLNIAAAEASTGSEKSIQAQVLEKEPELLKDIKVPPGFEVTIFAAAPAVNYPVFVSAAPDGTVYVSSDRNGSLDRTPNRGRILRVRDTDGDGHADEVKAFVPNVDSPRGLVWDHDRLYLLHPPHLSVYIDKDGDGVADEEKVLVKNIAFGFKDRPADHSSNGIELGIDGWIYCAIGDFGFMEAEGTDGRKLQLRGGGVVRVRPDGTGLELYSRGTRNILEACVSPLLDIFARDNTNDGDGWDTRLHHFAGLSEHGYPSYYKNFRGEFIEPLADYGGGSGCGGLYLDEPGFPEGYGNTLYTADWGRSWIYRHPLTPKGATFTIEQKEFLGATRTTDLDVDASSHLFISSWKGATFNYAGEGAGYLIRLSPKGYKAPPLPNIPQDSTQALVSLLEDPSHRRRLAAQRELLRRGFAKSKDTISSLKSLAAAKNKPLASRVAAIFALKQGLKKDSTGLLATLAQDASIREFAIRALADRLEENASTPAKTLIAGLEDTNPRVRREAAFALARLGKAENAKPIAKLLADSDPVVAHCAYRAMVFLKAPNPAFAVLDSAAPGSIGHLHAMYVLQSIHEKSVVDGLISRLTSTQDWERKRAVLIALCRLHFTHGIWKGDSWGTRPDTTGPYYQPVTWDETDRIASALNATLQTLKGTRAAELVKELGRHKVQSDQIVETVVGLAATDPNLNAMALNLIGKAEHLSTSSGNFLLNAATSDGLDDVTRANIVLGLSKLSSAKAVSTALSVLSAITPAGRSARDVQRARDAFVNSTNTAHFTDARVQASNNPGSEKANWALAALIKIADRRNTPETARETARQTIDAHWNNPKSKAQVIEAIGLTEHRPYSNRVLDSLDDADPEVAQTAKRVASAMRLDRSRRQPGNTTLDKMPVDRVVQSVLNLKGDIKQGEELFTKLTCANCHTVEAKQPLRGPFLGTIANTYKRPDLAEAVLLPNKSIAQGFAANHFELKDGTEYDGFVTLEAADMVTIRNVSAQEVQIPTKDIAKRVRMEKSLMPEGLAAALSLREFASLLDYLESLPSKQ